MSDPRPDPQVVFREVGGETVLVHLATNRIYALNPTGARVWDGLGRGVPLETLRAELAAEFKVEPDRVAREVDALVAELRREGLLR